MENELFNALKSINIPNSRTRPNISGEAYRDSFRIYGHPIKSCSFGYVNVLFNNRTMLSRISQNYPEVYQQLIEYGRSICPHEFTSICVNYCVMCKPHMDSKNMGISTIVGIGEYTGGGLFVENELHDIKHKPLTFDGSKQMHWTEPFEGDRITLVFFNVKLRKNLTG